LFVLGLVRGIVLTGLKVFSGKRRLIKMANEKKIGIFDGFRFAAGGLLFNLMAAGIAVFVVFALLLVFAFL